VQKKSVVCLSKRYIRKNRVDKAAGAEVQLLKQKSSVYKIKRKMA
jgi:hypothetical protein